MTGPASVPTFVIALVGGAGVGAGFRCARTLELTADAPRWPLAALLFRRSSLFPKHKEGPSLPETVDSNSDWIADLQPALHDLTKEQRASLARRWEEQGRNEQASVASFAHFTLAMLCILRAGTADPRCACTLGRSCTARRCRRAAPRSGTSSLLVGG